MAKIYLRSIGGVTIRHLKAANRKSLYLMVRRFEKTLVVAIKH